MRHYLAILLSTNTPPLVSSAKQRLSWTKCSSWNKCIR